MLKKLAVLAATLAVSAPAFADRGYGHGHGHGYYYNGPKHRQVVRHVYYRPAPPPRRVVVVHPAPRPVYVVERHDHVNPVAVLAGAVIGAAIVHHVVTGY